MLILTRRADESIMIGADIEVKVLRISGRQVHLGICAPRQVSVFRQEIHAQVQEQNRKALETSASARKLEGLPQHFRRFKSLLSTEEASAR